MAGKQKLWKAGRGKLGALSPLLGSWSTEADSPAGRVRCERTFASAIGGAFVTLSATWNTGGKGYHELAVFGIGDDGALTFWSFTSDGRRATGKRVAAPDLPAEALAFEAEMPAGLARQAYWPEADGTVTWVVEARNKSGWKRFLTHHYRRA